jgi:hypothetical protein
MDLQELVSFQKKKPENAINVKGELKVLKDGKEVNYPADSYMMGPIVMLGFGNRDAGGAMEEGVVLLIREANLGEKIELPHGTADVFLFSEGEMYRATEGTLQINYDESFEQAHGNLNVSIELGSPVLKLENGIFSIEPT